MPARFHAPFFIFLAILLGSGGPAWPGEGPRVLVLGDAARYDLAPYLEVLDSDDAGLTIDQVSTGPWRERFKPIRGSAFEAPSRDLRIHWLRFTAHAPKGSPAGKTTWFMETDYAYLSRIDFYRPTPDGWEVIKTGLNRPASTREVVSRSFAFLLPPVDNGAVTCYIRLETRGLNPMHFYALPLPAFIGETAKEAYLFAVFYGVLLSMILYNLFLAISLRDRVYFSYVGYIFFALFSLVLLHGQATAFWDFGLGVFITLFWGDMGLYTAFAYLFMRGFLNTRRLAPVIDKLLLGGFFYGLLVAVAGLMQVTWIGRWLAIGSALFSPWLALTAGIVSLRRGFAPARYFLYAWGTLAVALTIFALQELGPWQGRFWARHSLLIGTALESVLLSLGLAARIRELNRNIEERKKMQEHLTGMNRELEETNEKLQAAYQWMRDNKDLLKRSRYVEDIGFLVDREGRIEWVSEAALSFIGKSRQALIGGTLPELLHDESREAFRKAMQQAWTGVCFPFSVRFASGGAAGAVMDVKMTRVTSGEKRLVWVLCQRPAERARIPAGA